MTTLIEVLDEIIDYYDLTYNQVYENAIRKTIQILKRKRLNEEWNERKSKKFEDKNPIY